MSAPTSASAATKRRSGRSRVTALRRTLAVQLSSERMLPVIAALVVLGASIISFQPPSAIGATGSVNGPGTDTRLAIGGTDQLGSGEQLSPQELAIQLGGTRAHGATADLVAPTETYAADGILTKPVAVNTVVSDGKGLLETYTVRSGDTLTGIASHYGISMMTLWWANSLTAKDQLHVGQKLTVPPVDGLVVTVKSGDTLDSLVARYKIDATDVMAVNELNDPTLIIGQTLVLPDAVGAAIPDAPKPTVTKPRSTVCTNCGGGTYGGGKFGWPVVGGGNYVSQGFWSGHLAIDIAATYGSKVVAAAKGVVIFAGWKSNGGGYQVWISHGSNLYTTYNHMSAITVSAGQSVGRGQQVGRIGQSGNATGPHCHFEVWIGSIWNGGYRVNPLRYL